MTAPAIDTYEITATHPALSGPLVVELIATSEKAAISRARGTAVHTYHDVRLLHAEYQVTGKKAGVWPDGHGTTVAVTPQRSCRVCGCTDDDCSQCIERTGEPCSWADDDLCSACVTP